MPAISNSSATMTCAGLLGLAVGHGVAADIALVRDPKAGPRDITKDQKVVLALRALSPAVGEPLGKWAGRAPNPALALLMIPCANAHGGYFFGLALIGPFALEALLAAEPAARFAVVRDWGVFGVLSLAASLVTPFGLSIPAKETVQYVQLVMFFPNLEGFTPTNWRDLETSKDTVFVVIKRDAGARPVSTTAPCDKTTVSQRAGGRCEVVVVDPTGRLQIQAHFIPDDGARAKTLEARLGQMLKSWLAK